MSKNSFKKINMAFLRLIFLFVVLNGLLLSINGHDSNDGSGVPFTRDGAADVCDGTAVEKQCSKDCKNLLYCDGTTVKASAQCSPPYPYCDKGKCVQNVPAACSKMLCPKPDKFYPDPTNCFRYIYCNSKREVEQTITCPSNMPYDCVTGDCKYRMTCQTINCRSQYFAVHPGCPNLGSLCSNNFMLNHTYTDCPAAHQLGWSYSCEPKCSKVGIFAMIDDKTSYIKCQQSSGTTFLLTIIPCPKGEEFDETISKCKVATPPPGP